MTTLRRTIVRPSRISTVRCPSAPTRTNAVVMVRRPCASAGESAVAGRGFSAAEMALGIGPTVAESGPAENGSPDRSLVSLGPRVGFCIAESWAEGVHATAAAKMGSSMRIWLFLRVNTAPDSQSGTGSHGEAGPVKNETLMSLIARLVHAFQLVKHISVGHASRCHRVLTRVKIP